VPICIWESDIQTSFISRPEVYSSVTSCTGFPLYNQPFNYPKKKTQRSSKTVMSKIFFNCCICCGQVNSIFSAVWMVIPGFCWNQIKEKAEHNFADSQFGKPWMVYAFIIVLIWFASLCKPYTIWWRRIWIYLNHSLLYLWAILQSILEKIVINRREKLILCYKVLCKFSSFKYSDFWAYFSI